MEAMTTISTRTATNTLWDELYAGKAQPSYSVPMLGWFGARSYACYRRWIGDGDKRILEAGFGSARLCLALARDLPHSEITGIDISPRLVERATQIAQANDLRNVTFRQNDIFALSFPDETFDVVFNEGVIEHFPNYQDAFAEMVRVTKRGGKVVVGVPNWYCFPHTVRMKLKALVGSPFEYGWERTFKHSELIRLYKDFGLTNLEMTGHSFMQSITRLAMWNRFFKALDRKLKGRFTRYGRQFEGRVIARIDRYAGNAFSSRFGFEILIKGVKS